MSKKLLHKTQRIYLIFAIVTFIIVAPIFYLVSEKMYLKNIDETLLGYKADFLEKIAPNLSEETIKTWNRFNLTSKIKEYYPLKKDTLFYSEYFSKLELENEPYRELNSVVYINKKPFIFSTKISLFESGDLLTSILLLFLVLFVILLIGLIFLTRKISINLWKPFYKTLEEIEAFELDHPKKYSLDTCTIEEFNRLNESIDNLIKRNISIYNNQREFVENAAHELQTPIAIFKAKLDMLIQDKDISKKQYLLLNDISDTVSRLNKLNKNLLLLSKIDGNQPNKQEMISINEIVEKQLPFFREQAKSKNIKIAISAIDNCSLTANLTLTEVLIRNLLLNAIRHNHQDGEVHIELRKDKLIISNTSSNTKLFSEKLFVRFSKSSDSQSGNGLGLAIVKKIIDSQNWKITYYFQGANHIFAIHFIN
ncbi:Sensor histidine kinase ResE [Polaribacter huanghezhanensis]|uniref:sensor histidine kinase n=1 Tax=Polaribacter huanghezhanensis TaxID=1354726 RepID=UPI0026470E82|nr:HAMP domain-containing sensor histidine kinase [Polaribacter huanghezhanensis]WKD86653.1 Sensor histidine kinase ResE [Polaribacter huanghezhanensis]